MGKLDKETHRVEEEARREICEKPVDTREIERRRQEEVEKTDKDRWEKVGKGDKVEEKDASKFL